MAVLDRIAEPAGHVTELWGIVLYFAAPIGIGNALLLAGHLTRQWCVTRLAGMAKDNGDSDLPRRENKEQRKANQAKAAAAEHIREGFPIGGRPGRDNGDWGHDRDS